MAEQNLQINKTHSGALDAFLNLLTLITLGWSAISFGRLFFLIINKFFSPEFIAGFAAYSQSGLKFNIASLIVVVPVFLVVTGYLHQAYRQEKLNPASGIHRWLTYLMLLIAALNIIGSLIAVIFKLLDGDYTLGTLLKIATVFLIALGIFGYYWYDLRRKDYRQRSAVSVIAATTVVILTLSAVIGSFFLIDSPAVARMKNFDRLRIDHLNQLNNLIQYQYSQDKVLPADLAAAKFSHLVDPENGRPYDYQVVADKKYELCATFSLPAERQDGFHFGPADWYFHDAGYQCFVISIYELVGDESAPLPVR